MTIPQESLEELKQNPTEDEQKRLDDKLRLLANFMLDKFFEKSTIKLEQ